MGNSCASGHAQKYLEKLVPAVVSFFKSVSVFHCRCECIPFFITCISEDIML